MLSEQDKALVIAGMKRRLGLKGPLSEDAQNEVPDDAEFTAEVVESWIPGDPDVPDDLDESDDSPTGVNVPHMESVDGPGELVEHYELFGEYKIVSDRNGYKVYIPEYKRVHRYIADDTSPVTPQGKLFKFAGEGFHDEHS